VIVETHPVGLLQCNCTIVGCPQTREAIVVDPGGDAPLILERVAALGLKVVRIVHTHAHFDHVMGTRELQEATGAPVDLHPDEHFLYDDLAAQLALVGLPPAIEIPAAPPVDHHLEDGETLRFGEAGTLVIHSPGHTPGSCCFSLPTADGLLLLAGDTLFRGSVGRTDFPRGSFDALQASIRDRLLPLDDATRVIPGHGPETSIGLERRQNPFLADA